MKNLGLVFALAALAAVVPAAGTTTYYVDSSGGDDGNDGLAPSRAWKTLDKVNAVTFASGDRILFKAGSRYEGQLRSRGSGAEGNPIVVDTYGEGAKPRIAAAGKFGEALLLVNQDYWEAGRSR